MTKLDINERPIVEACLSSANDLLINYWKQIKTVRDAEDGKVAIAIQFSVDVTGESPVVKTKVSFSRKYKDDCEIVVNTNQMKFDFLKEL
jgi:hypothetical protein